MTSALVDLSGLIDPGWQPVGAVGYYVHRGHVYLAGVLATLRGPVGGITDPSAPPAGRTLIAALPEAIRPTVPIHASLPVDPENTTDAGTPVLNLPTTPYAVTVDPSGTIRLDADPPGQVNTTPDPSVYFYYLNIPGAHAQWGTPLALALGLASLTWRVALVGDTFTPEPLGPFLHAAHFADIDSGFFIHGERIHLTGSVRAVIDGAQTLLDPLPPGTADGLPAHVPLAITDGLGVKAIRLAADANDATVSGDYVVAVKTAADDPPLTSGSPPLTSGVDAGFATQNFTVQDPTAYDDDAGGEVGVIHGRVDGLGGYSVCAMPPALHIDAFCSGGAFIPDLTFDVNDLLAQVVPRPQWFWLQFAFFVLTATDWQGFAIWPSSGCTPVVGEHGGGCGPQGASMADGTGTWSIAGAGGLADSDGTPRANSLTSGGGIVWSPPGGLPAYVRPPTSLYRGAAELLNASGPPAESLIWRADQADAITLSIDGTLGSALPGGRHFSGEDESFPNSGPYMNWFATIAPLYERRQMGLHAGDVLTLEGSGWPGVLSAPGPLVGSIDTGAAATGIVPRALR